MLIRKLSPSFNEAASVLAGPGITELIKRAHAPLPGMLETENMNADQGFRRAPGNLLRVAASAGAAALIVTAVSATRRARTAMADREPSADATGPGAPSGPLTTVTAQATPDVARPP